MENILKNSLHIQNSVTESVRKSIYHQTVQVIVVSKQQSLEDVKALYELGYRHFAENRVDKLLERQEQLPYTDIVWHLIGTLQSRKVKEIINVVDYIHSVDTKKLLQTIENRANIQKNVFLQINLFNEPQKHGFTVEELDDVIQFVSQLVRVNVVGLMCMAPIDASEKLLHEKFKQLKNIQQEIQNRQILNVPCTCLSMGMSQDYKIAIENGATHVRIGSAFFEK